MSQSGASDRKFRSLLLRSPHFIPQSRFVCTEDGKPAVDFLGRFETLERDFAALRERVPAAGDLPKANVGDHDDYRNCYDANTRRIVGDLYAQDIKLFGYDFDERRA